jgi:hypothetical protein
MLVMLACAALLAAGLAVAVRWRHHTLEVPSWAATADGGVGSALRALVWLLGVATVSGLLVGVLVVGPAGRLAMRLLAATSPEAQGRITDAGEVVGEITLSGTIGFFVFVGLPFGLGVGIAYALVSWLLPRGVLGGAVLGALLLVVLGSALDPLREANPDFDILGPGWLSVLTFVAMALLTGMVTAPVAGRVGRALANPRLWWAAWLAPITLLAAAALLAAAPGALALLLAGCAVFVAALLVRPARRDVVRRGRRVLQAALAGAAAVTAPGFVSAVATIVA